MCPWAGQAPRVAGSPVPGAESRQLMEHGFLSRVVCPGGTTGDSCCWLLISRLIPLPWRYNDLVLQRKVVGIGDERGLSAVKHQDFVKAAARKICVPTPCSSSRGTKSPVRPEGSAFVVGVHAGVGGSAADVMASDLSTGSAASATLH